MILRLLLRCMVLLAMALPGAAMAQDAVPMASAPLPPPLPKVTAKPMKSVATATKTVPGKPVMPGTMPAAAVTHRAKRVAAAPPRHKPAVPAQAHREPPHAHARHYADRNPAILDDPDWQTRPPGSDVAHVPDRDVDIAAAPPQTVPPPPAYAPAPYGYYRRGPLAYAPPYGPGYGYGPPQAPGFAR